MHKQVWTKVNAQVDEGIVDLIEALSLFPQLTTIESCQDLNPSGAFVCFQYGGDCPESWRNLSEFVLGYLGPGLMAELGDLVNISITVTTWGDSRCDLSIRDGVIDRATKTIRKLAKKFNKKQKKS